MDKLLKLIFLSLLLPYQSLANKDYTSDVIVQKPLEKFLHEPQPIQLTNQYRHELNKIENYLNDFQTMVSKFKQSSQGEISYGTLMISKPGKIRCEYHQPSPLLLIVKDDRVIYYDQEIDEITYTSTDLNALKLLAQSNLNFNSLNLVEIEKNDQFISVSIKEDSQELKQNLYLTLRFTYPHISLVQVTITTEAAETDIIFEKIDYSKKLDKKLFEFHRDIFKRRR